jgi:predicted nicotinamide N-methyase
MNCLRLGRPGRAVKRLQAYLPFNEREHPLPYSLDAFHRQYDTDIQEISIAGRRYRFYLPASIERFIHAEDPLQDFPLWAKIWQAGVVLAGHMAKLPPDNDRRILEIGAGLGLVSIVAADHGHRVRLTDFNADAMNFARANATLNGCPDVEVAALDWRRPGPADACDMLIGSEVIYKEEDVETLLALFAACLKPGGRIVLAEEVRKTLDPFLKSASRIYRLGIRRFQLRSENETSTVVLIELRSRDPHQ